MYFNYNGCIGIFRKVNEPLSGATLCIFFFIIGDPDNNRVEVFFKGQVNRAKFVSFLRDVIKKKRKKRVPY